MNRAHLNRMLRMRYVRAVLLAIFIAAMAIEKAWVFVGIGAAFLGLAIYQIRQLAAERAVAQKTPGRDALR